MSAPISVASKARPLIDNQTVVAAGALPAFPTGPDANGRVQYAGDFRGARIHGFEFVTGTLTGVTSLGASIEHSMDGVAWSPYKTLTASAGNTTTSTMLNDDDVMAKSFLRVNFSAAAGAFGNAAGVTVRVLYDQVGPVGNLRPPGYKDRAY